MRLNVLRGFLGGNGGCDYGSMELHADPILHRLTMSMSQLPVKERGGVERIMVRTSSNRACLGVCAVAIFNGELDSFRHIFRRQVAFAVIVIVIQITLLSSPYSCDCCWQYCISLH